jgi:hypothetical protein
LPEHPAIFVLHPLQKKLPKRINRWLPGKAIINVLIIGIGLEPEFISVAQEQQAEKKKDENESK